MPVVGKHAVGPEHGRLMLRTARQGLAAQVGHDLLIEVTSWSGAVTVAEDPAASSVDITIDTGSLVVREGTGGIKPLSERDIRDIAQTTRRLLRVDRHPRARFVSTEVRPRTGGAELAGTFSLAGTERPLTLTVVELGVHRYRATGRVVQSEYGIKPYSAMLGALKLADPVEVEVELDLSASAD